MTDTNIVTVGQLDTVVDALCDANDARFANKENVYTKTEIDNKMSTLYKRALKIWLQMLQIFLQTCISKTR